MKRIITLALFAGAFTTGFAQSQKEDAKAVILGGQSKSSGSTSDRSGSGSKEDARSVIFGDGSDGNVHMPGKNRRNTGDAEIDRINREYDAKISSIRNNPTLSAEEKERMIRGLERERQRKINAIYKNRKDRDDDDGDDDRKEKKVKKGNNGNHYGWEKGVGNPHKNGGSPHDRKDQKGHSQKGKSNGKGKK